MNIGDVLGQAVRNSLSNRRSPSSGGGQRYDAFGAAMRQTASAGLVSPTKPKSRTPSEPAPTVNLSNHPLSNWMSAFRNNG